MKDITGKSISVDDWITYSYKRSTDVAIRFGKVLEVNDRNILVQGYGLKWNGRVFKLTRKTRLERSTMVVIYPDQDFIRRAENAVGEW